MVRSCHQPTYDKMRTEGNYIYDSVYTILSYVYCYPDIKISFLDIVFLAY